MRNDSLSSHETPSRNANATKSSLPLMESEYLEDEGAAKYKKQNLQISKELSDIIIYIQVGILIVSVAPVQLELRDGFSLFGCVGVI